MKDARKPYHLADGIVNGNKEYHTYCKRFVDKSHLIGPHVNEPCRLCHVCRREVKKSINAKWGRKL